MWSRRNYIKTALFSILRAFPSQRTRHLSGVTSQVPKNCHFSPTVNGFQFGNEIPKETVSYLDTLNQLNSTSNSIQWTRKIPSYLKPKIAQFSLRLHQLQLGNCFGMSLTAKYYFEHPDKFAHNFPTAKNMYQVNSTNISSEIVANQFPGQATGKPYLLNVAITYFGLKNLNDETQWIIHELDNHRVVQLYLTKRIVDPSFFHSVLVFDYEITKATIFFDVYDPNHSGETRKILLTKDQNGDFKLNSTGSMDDVVTEYGVTDIGAGEHTNVDWSTVASYINDSPNVLSQITLKKTNYPRNISSPLKKRSSKKILRKPKQTNSKNVKKS